LIIIIATCLLAGIFYVVSTQRISQIILDQTSTQMFKTKETFLKDTVNNVIHQIDLFRMSKTLDLESRLEQIEDWLEVMDEKHPDANDFESNFEQYLRGIELNEQWFVAVDHLHLETDETPVFEEETIVELERTIRNHNLIIAYPKARFDQDVLEFTRELIYRYSFEDNSYLWINQVLNYEGGDDYAIRLVHPNLKDTEGSLLSTHTQDIQGNLPFQLELEGVKSEGDIFFRYFFQKKDSLDIKEKRAYAKLYEPYDWIIAYGVYLDDINGFMEDVKTESQSLINRWIALLSLMLVGLFSIGLGLITYLERRIKVKETHALKLELDSDSLTQAYSRRALDFYLLNAFERYQNGEESPLFLLADIDDFKRINDQYGHIMGDKVLKLFASTIIERNRKEDRVYRMGGDEFIFVYEGVREENDELLVQIILDCVRGIDIEGIKITSSIGYGRFIKVDNSAQDLINRIDKALYKAKNKGKNSSST
jgi:diguanylate cyclase (GGDEF)-like protein